MMLVAVGNQQKVHLSMTLVETKHKNLMQSDQVDEKVQLLDGSLFSCNF